MSLPEPGDTGDPGRSGSEPPDPLPAGPPPCARRRRYSADYKLAMVRAYERLDHAGRRALLRREGLYNSLISAWRQQCDRGALAELGKQRGRKPADPVAREMARLRDENQRLADALSRAKQLIEFQGK